ncbi:tRNA pseudouridine(54/55) synthase Pus10 [Methanohalobium sp.]|uniref:tRNA pseudouridine(54/55) synthase Pus10 n=1 Tax=Methanohalobium sp. TaxID=2837493 RepID=UPI0025DAA906|nr:tRNA pseudouridine(54/55) synthase Pus10 [Methanohalobium sp.]
MNLIEIARKIIQEGTICDHCLGRQFAKLSTGLGNYERGKSIKTYLTMEGDRLLKDENDDSLLKELAPISPIARRLTDIEPENETCWVCLGLFDNLEQWAERAVSEMDAFEYDNFLVGTKMSGLLSENEEILWTESGTTYAEQLKSELNREIGKRINVMTGKEVGFENPDIVVMLDLTKEDVLLEVRSVYIYGRYRKHVRGIPQTRWPCRSCRGKGCQACEYTGKQYKESVDELISKQVINKLQCIDTKFHGSGREDIDALMLGDGRPFVIEAVRPTYRHFDINKLENDINEYTNGKVEVTDLQNVSRDLIETLKSSNADKVYKLKVTFKEPVSEEKLKSAINNLKGVDIEQRTPQRVSHRRGDLVRKRRVYDIELSELTDSHAVITVNCEGGLYVKELISGDNRRTEPNLSNIIGTQADVTELDVINVNL